MPGHVAAAMTPATSGADPSAELQRSWSQLDTLIANHDAVFLLTDSRESRWLPTLLAQAHRKLTINVALGFDSYLVMRHGVHSHPVVPSSSAAAATGDAPATSPSPSRLSCYFCADVVAPGDSMSDRTLDQQCTVTRPGLAPVAGGLAVELMASLSQHPLGALAPAPPTAVATATTATAAAASGCLGVVPHQVRGALPFFQQQLLAGTAFDRCIACSSQVRDEFPRPCRPFHRCNFCVWLPVCMSRHGVNPIPDTLDMCFSSRMHNVCVRRVQQNKKQKHPARSCQRMPPKVFHLCCVRW